MNPVLRRQLREGASSPLTPEREFDVGRRIALGHRDAAMELVASHLPFVIAIANKYRHLGLPMDDLFSEGSIGLMQAAGRFDHTRGVRFLSYAAWWNRKAIRKAINDQSSVVRIPEYRRTQLSREIETGSPRLSVRRNGRGPLDTPSKQAAVLSIDEPVGEGSPLLRDTLADNDGVCPEDEVLRRDLHGHLRNAFSMLSSREKLVITHRFGLADDRPRTLQQISSVLGVSRERVRQIEKRACRRMREHLVSRKTA